MAQILTYILLFALPFIVGSFGVSFFESPKIYTAQFLIEIFLLFSLFKVNLSQKLRLAPVQVLLVCIFAFTLAQILFYPSPFFFTGNQFRRQGIFLLWHLVVFAFLASTINKQNKYSHLPLISRIALIALFLSSFFFGTSADGRAVGTFGEPNSLGIYAAFLWPFTQSFWFLLPTFGVILLSGSRSAVIALGIQVLFIILVQKFRISTVKSTVICLLFIVLCLLLPFFETQAEYQNRPLIWQTTYKAGLEKPFFGWGFGNTETAISFEAKKLENSLRYEYVDSAHNILLDWWVQGGILGVVLLTALIAFTLKNLVTSATVKDTKLLSFLALLTGLLFNPVSIAILVPFWWLIGVCKNEPEIRKV